MAFEAVTTHDEKENIFQSFPKRGWGVFVHVCLTN